MIFLQLIALLGAFALAFSYRAISYFAVLGAAIFYCFAQPVGMIRKAASVLCVAVTWFYIIRFMVTYDGPMNAFDAAYADVIWGGSNGNWGHTQTLLSWAVVVTVWSSEAPVFYTLFGVFGAMSGSYLLLRPEIAEFGRDIESGVKLREPLPLRQLPVQYAIFAPLALGCVWMLPYSETATELGWWLWGLHVFIVLPKFVPSKILCWNVDRCLVLVALALMSLAIHVSAGRSPMPTTDCQISITIDAVVCSCITLAYIAGRSGAAEACVWAVLMPLLSPGFVLAAFGADRCCGASGVMGRVVTAVQWRAACQLRARDAASDADARSSETSAMWMNLGYWKDTKHYSTACRQLASKVGEAAGLSPGSSLLCIACGYGDELPFFRDVYKLDRVVGLDANPDATRQFKRIAGQGVSLVRGVANDARRLFRPNEFKSIISVDGIYHCDKVAFFKDCAALLPLGEAGGSVAITDVAVKPGAPAWVRLALSGMGVHRSNQWTAAEYAARVAAATEGCLEITRCESLEPFVLAPWFPPALREHLDYLLVAGKLTQLPASRSQQKRPTAAVIGSGMSGLVAAHLLSETHDVQIFEARPEPGLAGLEARPDGSDMPVDIPLRMIEPNYWRTLVDFCDCLGVPLEPTNFTVCIHDITDDNCTTSGAHLKTHNSLVRTLTSNIAHYGQIAVSVLRLCCMPATERETLSEYVKRLDFSQNAFYRKYALRHLSWVLSCTYESVEKYPAKLILEFFLSIAGNYFKSENPTYRIYPSVRALQERLLAGKTINCGKPVAPFAERGSEQAPRREIDGQHFDAVVIATEANAVPKLLPTSWTDDVFGKFQYHPSRVFVHRDPSAMPPDKADWRAINVSDDEKGEACQITVWVNEYYQLATADLGGDVFETVNPRQLPKAELVIKEVHMQRCVHTPDSAALQAKIAALQGREGFYFAGAYAVPGMGLLEQACRSSREAVDAIRRDMAATK